MRYFLTALPRALQSLLRSRSAWIFLLLLSLLGTAGHFQSRQTDSGAIEVGIVLSSDREQELLELLNTDSRVRFVPCTEEELQRRVISNRWDCGVILAPDFDARLQRLEVSGLMTIVTGPASALDPLIREHLSAVVTRLASPVIAEAYADSNGLISPDDRAYADQRLQQVLPQSQQVRLNVRTLDGQSLDAAGVQQHALQRGLVGVIGVLLLVWMLFSAMDLGRNKDLPVMRRMAACRNPAVLLLPGLSCAMGWAMGIGSAALVLCLGRDAVGVVLPLAAYLVLLGGIALLLACSRCFYRNLPVLIPFAAAASLVICPVLWDCTVFLPRLGWLIRSLPLSLFLSGCDGSTGACLGMAAAGLAGGALAALRARSL